MSLGINCADSNPKDIEFFKVIKNIPLLHSKIAAFGSTRRAKVKASQDDKSTAGAVPESFIEMRSR